MLFPYRFRYLRISQAARIGWSKANIARVKNAMAVAIAFFI